MKLWTAKISGTVPGICRCLALLVVILASSSSAGASEQFEAMSGGSGEAAGTAVSSVHMQPQVEPEVSPGGWVGLVPSGESSGWQALRPIGATLFIVAIILTGAVLLKRYMPNSFGSLRTPKRIHVLESVTIGEKRTLTLVEIDHSTLLLASSPTVVSLIKEFGAPHGAGPESRVLDAVEDRLTLAETNGIPRFRQTLLGELAAPDSGADPRRILARLSQIRQGLEAR
jgi:flagellar biogenesis protein FliO